MKILERAVFMAQTNHDNVDQNTLAARWSAQLAT
jgi:hypothetical protein